MKPGIYDISFEEYQAIDAINMSKLKDIKRSPAHFYAQHLSPLRVPFKDTNALRFGRMVHTYILEPHLFDDEYPSATLAEKYQLKSISDKLFSKQISQLLLRLGVKKETTLVWSDAEAGVICKGRLDAMIEPCNEFQSGLIIDLKTTKNGSSGEFQKSAYNYGYQNSAAWYCKGFQQFYKTDVFPPFIYFVLEKEPPFEVAFYVADMDFINFGFKENDAMLTLYKKCVDNNNWPGYSDDIQELSLPGWVRF